MLQIASYVDEHIVIALWKNPLLLQNDNEYENAEIFRFRNSVVRPKGFRRVILRTVRK